MITGLVVLENMDVVRNGLCAPSGLGEREVRGGAGGMVVTLVELKGRRRLADLGKSNRPPLLLFWPVELRGGIVVQHAIV